MDDVSTILTPDAYARWRATRLGARVEQIEVRVVFDLAGPLAGKRVLDAGTGDGTYAIEAAVRGAEVTALDASAAMLEAARARAHLRGVSLRLQAGRVERLPFEAEHFDVVLAVTLLCSIKDPACALHEIARVLVPGGRLVVGELGRWSAWAAKRRLESLRRATFWTATRFWTRRELERQCTVAGLEIQAARGAVYFPPLAWAAQLMARIDPALARFGTIGAAFLCVASRKPSMS
jgi:ubiquinone/menaquinone biosynthesis C-methylase UbiE